MLIDLRTDEERRLAPAPAGFAYPMPRPPYDPRTVASESRQLADELLSLPPDTPLRFFCAAGKRSALAAGVAKALGFSNVENLGGLVARDS